MPRARPEIVPSISSNGTILGKADPASRVIPGEATTTGGVPENPGTPPACRRLAWTLAAPGHAQDDEDEHEHHDDPAAARA